MSALRGTPLGTVALPPETQQQQQQQQENRADVANTVLGSGDENGIGDLARTNVKRALNQDSDDNLSEYSHHRRLLRRCYRLDVHHRGPYNHQRRHYHLIIINHNKH